MTVVSLLQILQISLRYAIKLTVFEQIENSVGSDYVDLTIEGTEKLLIVPCSDGL